MSIKIDRFFHSIKQDIIHTLHPLQTFFIEINSTCNLNCKHCYIPPSSKQNILNLEDVERIIKTVKGEWGKSVGIAITGGEPLIHPDFKDIAEVLYREEFNWSLATNGQLLDTKMINFLKEKGCRTMTISLDGNEETHDVQRNSKGAFKKTIKVVDNLIENEYPNIYLTATIHDQNIESLDDLFVLIKKYGNSLKWRISPLLYCENVEINNLSMSRKTLTKIYDFYHKVKRELDISILPGEKNMLSIKYKQYFDSEFDSCLAGITTFGVLSNGDIVNCMVCRDKVLGNILKGDSLKTIWAEEELDRKPLCEKHYESEDSLLRD